MYFLKHLFLDFIKQKLGHLENNLRHSSLHPDLNSMYVKFQRSKQKLLGEISLAKDFKKKTHFSNS